MRHRVKRFLSKRLILVFMILLTFTAASESEAVELSDFVGDFGSTNCGSPTSCQGDIDADGDVDGKDLASVMQSFLPEISFAVTGQAADEGETVLLDLLFSKPFSGELIFELIGPASEGAVSDHGFTCPDLCNASISSDTQPTLDVSITDDTEIEEIEWLGIRLQSGPGYRVGAMAEHVLTIEDNDAVWEGIFTSRGEEIGFSLEILRSAATVTATLLPEGGGIIPAGAAGLDPFDLQFSLTFDLTAETFSATLPAVPLASSDTLLGTEGTMSLELQASQSTGSVSANLVEGDKDLGSTTIMRIQFSSQPHLNSDVPGSFVLQKRPAKPSIWEVPLENIN